MPTGVLDSGVVLTRLDRRRRSHGRVVALFDRAAARAARLHVSVVNLAEVLQHARPYTQATGVDPVAVLQAYDISLHSPDAETARRVAELESEDLSLAERFAIATATILKARFYTTDGTLASAARRLRLAVTHF